MKTKDSFFSPKSLAVVFGIAILGVITLFISHAESSSTISGAVFKDVNRNQIMDPGEQPMAGVPIYLLDSSETRQLASTTTDIAGRYSFSGLADGMYHLDYDPESWWAIRRDQVPTTTGSIFPKITVNLTGAAAANFGWRQIVRSADRNAPITTYTGPNGLKANSYDDVIPAHELYDTLMRGTLVRDEVASKTTIAFDLSNQPNISYISVDGGQGNWSNYSAEVNTTYISWLDTGDNTLFHEYGHAWSQYYAYIFQQNLEFKDYLQLRGIANDPRLNSSHGWTPTELIAEDYRQLFGTPTAQSAAQENRELPLAKDVPGLKDYLSGPYMVDLRDTAAPSIPNSLNGRAVSQNEINLSWAASTDNVGVKQYYIYRNGQFAGTTNAPSITFTDINLKPGTAYQYTVRALDAANNISAHSAAITISTLSPDTQKPSTPTNLTSPSQTTTTIGLKWNLSTDNVGVTRYLIYQIGGSRKNIFANQIGTSTSPSFTVSNLSRGTSYSFYVVAEDAAGNQSLPSSSLSVKTKR